RARRPVRSLMTPPRFATWIAGRRVPQETREFVLGDLAEEFDEMAASELGARAARRWYWRQALRSLLTRHRRHRRPHAPKETAMHTFHDVRFALRLLRRTPVFTATAVVTLALGIGATTAIFSVVHAVLLAPLPFPNGARLVVAMGGRSLPEGTPISYPQFLE